jgi:hypothetical protein
VGSLLILSEKMHDDDSGCLQWSYEGNHFEFYLSKELSILDLPLNFFFREFFFPLGNYIK